MPTIFGFCMNKTLEKDAEPQKNEEGYCSAYLACFDAHSELRKTIMAKTFTHVDFAFGEMLFVEIIGDGELADDVEVRLSRVGDLMKTFNMEHETDIGQRAIFTLKNFEVDHTNLLELGIYKNETFGRMKDPKGVMEPGKYYNMTFQVVPTPDNSTFEYVVLAANTLSDKGAALVKEMDENRFERMPEVIKVENDVNIQASTETWKIVGTLRLDEFNMENLFAGPRPVLSLVDQSKGLVFEKLIQSALILLVKQKKDENGVLIDDPDFPKQLGTALPHKEALKTVVKLKKDFIDSFKVDFAIGDIFRVEAEASSEDYLFWKMKKYEQSDMFQNTLNVEKEDSERIHGLVEKLAMNSDIISSLKDKATQPENLNDTQKKAIQMALNEERKLVCIQGPPGTGKTFTLSVLIAKLMQPKKREVVKKKAIVLTPTREALRNIMSAAKATAQNMRVKLHEHAFMDQTTFMKILEESPEQKVLAERVAVLEHLFQKGSLSHEQYQKMKTNLVNETFKEKMNQIMQNVRVIFSTITSGFVVQATRDKSFENALCIIDEAAQVKESETWPAIIKLSRVVLAGDPSQLPALVVSEEARDFGLGKSLMTRIMENKENYSWIMLRNQYRSHEDITEWSSKSFYANEIQNSTNSSELQLHFLFNMLPKQPFDRLYHPFVFVDTSYETARNENVKTFEHPCTIGESHGKSDGLSFCNVREGEIVVKHYLNLIERGIKEEEMAIITPYRGQKDYVEQLFKEHIDKKEDDKTAKKLDFSKIKIGTVDSYQGQEFTVVICSLVRSNPKYNLGFVADLARLNVAITRAKRHFMFVGNGIMLLKSRNEKIRSLFDIFIRDRHRFPPSFVYENAIPYDINSSRNNFGQDLRDFSVYCKNWKDQGSMYRHCENWVKRKNEIKLGTSNQQNKTEQNNC